MAGLGGMFVPSWSPDGKYVVAIADPPKRMVVYSRETKTWRTLKQFGADWGFWRWSNDSKSILMAKIAAEPGEQPGVYRLNIADANGLWFPRLMGCELVRAPSRTFSRLHPTGDPP